MKGLTDRDSRLFSEGQGCSNNYDYILYTVLAKISCWLSCSRCGTDAARPTTERPGSVKHLSGIFVGSKVIASVAANVCDAYCKRLVLLKQCLRPHTSLPSLSRGEAITGIRRITAFRLTMDRSYEGCPIIYNII